MAIIKPPESIMIGLAEATAIYAIYQSALPSHTEIRAAKPHDTDVEAARKKAAWTSAAVLGFVYLLTRDLNSFLLGGLALGGIDFLTKHANGTDPKTGKLSAAPAGGAITSAGTGNAEAYPMPDYTDSPDMSYAS